MNTVSIGGKIEKAQFWANDPNSGKAERLVLNICNEEPGKDGAVYKTYFTAHLFGQLAAKYAETLVKGVEVLLLNFQVGSAKSNETWQTIIKSTYSSVVAFPAGMPGAIPAAPGQPARAVEARGYEPATGRPVPKAASVTSRVVTQTDDDDDLPF